MLLSTALIFGEEVGFDYPAYVTMRETEETCTMTGEMPDGGIVARIGGREKLLELVQRGRRGDRDALEMIFRHFRQPLFNLALRYTRNAAVSEDLLQDVFLKVFTHLKDLDRDGAFVGWIYRITIRTCLSYLRSHQIRARKTVVVEDVGNLAGTGNLGEEDLWGRSIEDAVVLLPPRLKSVFLLHDVQGFKHREIAEIMGCSEGTCKSQLFKARMKIRKHLKQKGMFQGDNDEMR